jgi:hypothetical protein
MYVCYLVLSFKMSAKLKLSDTGVAFGAFPIPSSRFASVSQPTGYNQGRSPGDWQGQAPRASYFVPPGMSEEERVRRATEESLRRQNNGTCSVRQT